ncbi:MAG: hypothetical protein H6871_10335 [Methylobacteriaceae bacterium]|nr:hypothetical protein [Methylobacteriaceae bacterium]
MRFVDAVDALLADAAAERADERALDRAAAAADVLAAPPRAETAAFVRDADLRACALPALTALSLALADLAALVFVVALFVIALAVLVLPAADLAEAVRAAVVLALAVVARALAPVLDFDLLSSSAVFFAALALAGFFAFLVDDIRSALLTLPGPVPGADGGLNTQAAMADERTRLPAGQSEKSETAWSGANATIAPARPRSRNTAA